MRTKPGQRGRVSKKVHIGVNRASLLGRRYYSPTLARWLSRDPAEELGGLNLYSFVVNNALSVLDGHGLANVSVNRCNELLGKFMGMQPYKRMIAQCNSDGYLLEQGALPPGGSVDCTCLASVTTGTTGARHGEKCVVMMSINVADAKDEPTLLSVFKEEFQHYFDMCHSETCGKADMGSCAQMSCGELRGIVAAGECDGNDFEGCWKQFKTDYWDRWLSGGTHPCHKEVQQGHWTRDGAGIKQVLKQGCKIGKAAVGQPESNMVTAQQWEPLLRLPSPVIGPRSWPK